MDQGSIIPITANHQRSTASNRFPFSLHRKRSCDHLGVPDGGDRIMHAGVGFGNMDPSGWEGSFKGQGEKKTKINN